ncbi:MAG: ATP-binding cassette domain-containing protein [Azospirillum sp.]|nr:ATP-binding cassette domain-containing protein [Azospirillum sp.]
MADQDAALTALLWPASRAGDAAQALIRQSGLGWGCAPARPDGPDRGDPDHALMAIGAGFGVEIEPVTVAYGGVGEFLIRAAPALLRLPGDGLLAVLGTTRGGRLGLSRGAVRCLGPDGAVAAVTAERIRAQVVAPSERAYAPGIAAVLDAVGLVGDRRDRAEAALLTEQLADQRLAAGWLLRPGPGAPWSILLREGGVLAGAAWLAGAAALVQGGLTLSWLVIGGGALSGTIETAWLDAWSLLLLGVIPCHLLGLWAEGTLALKLGCVVKRRLLYGMLRLEPDEIRSRGSGQFMGMAMMADAVETAGLAGGLLALFAGLRLAAALAVLALGAGGTITAAVLLLWLACAAWLVHLVWRSARDWAESLRALTNDLIERIAGHRTRLAQERMETWHDQEDIALEAYWRRGLGLDRITGLFDGILARGWMAVALIGVVGIVGVDGAGTGEPVALGLCLLGVLLGYQSLLTLGQAVPSLVQMAVARRELRPVFEAAARPEPAVAAQAPAPAASAQASPEASGGVDPAQPLISAGGLRYAYPGGPGGGPGGGPDGGPGADDVLTGCDLEIRAGERLLIEGPSGSGKSTLAALLCGLRRPTGGYLMSGGRERHLVADGAWRRRLLGVPQFHENHVFSGTFAFNLLMGRGWPPSPSDLAEARQVCQELGLGPLVDRMPAGFQQTVGDGGWQLSHGERSRLYIARALLQRAELVVLDESFSALDPETLERAFDCVRRRTATLVVVAHP